MKDQVQQKSDISLGRIERNILILTVILSLTALLMSGPLGSLGALLGGVLSVVNFKLIRWGVSRLMASGSFQARRRYLFLSAAKLMILMILLGGIFIVTKPSILFMLGGISLFIPGILWETLYNFKRNALLEETISDY